MLGLRCCTPASSRSGERGLVFLQFTAFLLYGFSYCKAQALEAQASGHLPHMESSQTRDRNCIPCIGGGCLSTPPKGKSKRVFLFFTSGQNILNHLDSMCYCVSPDTPPPSLPHSESARRPVDKVSGLTKGEIAKKMDEQGNFSKSLKNQLKLPY